MRASLAQYTNEFVSLAIMALMAIALIAGQAGAAQHTVSEPTLEARGTSLLGLRTAPSRQAVEGDRAGKDIGFRNLTLGQQGDRLGRQRLDHPFGRWVDRLRR